MNGTSARSPRARSAAMRSPMRPISPPAALRSARILRTVGTSLSPRPERFTRMIACFGSVGASLRTCAIAWADSSAGMMPSMRVRLEERVERLLVGDRHVLRAAAVAEAGVLGTDAGIVEAGRDRVRREDLAVVVGQHDGASGRAGRRVTPATSVAPWRPVPIALPARLDADHLHRRVVEERMEEAHRVRAAADARDQHVGQLALPSRGSGGAPRCRSRAGSRARSSDTGAAPSPSRCSSRWSRRWSPSRASPR